ncbi:MAG TPA: hypothetical protein VF707_08325 [Ardenticatenaceae bacterium]|jgi:hypothetical protein
MTREELIQVCQQAPKVGTVGHEEFVDYIVVLEQPRKVNGQWEKKETAYMSVDGKVAMANEDHRRQGKRLDFEDPVILVDDEKQLTLLVAVTSELYGRRHGIATSRKAGGSSAEVAHPWEIAETSAIGRALSGMGYGVIPGSGLASAEDVSRARETEQLPEEGARRGNGQRRTFPATHAVNGNGQAQPAQPEPRRGQRAVSPFQRQKIFELYGELYPDADVQAGVNALFQQEVGYSLEQATYDEGRQLTAYLLREKRNGFSPAPDAIAN